MRIRRTLALAGALTALSLILVSAALAAGASVSVRVEGVNRTLLPASVVHTRSGSITKGATPAGVCPASSAAGALDVATRHRWGGTYDAKYAQLELTSILGESWPFTQLKYYWGVWVNNRYATTGMCLISLHRGDRVLFAADSVKKHEHPLGLTAPGRAPAGKSFKVKVVWYSDSGTAKSLAGASVKGVAGKTDKRGVLTVSAPHAGSLKLSAFKQGYIRSATAAISVS